MNIDTLQERLKYSNLFLTGGAGVGKTTLTNELIKSFESEGKKVAKLASTGMAATLLGGQTLHSFFEFGIASNLEELERDRKLTISKKLKRILHEIDLIIIDEISMVSADLLDMIRLRLLQADFSGRVMVVGDFLQLPPITKGEVHFAFESESWERFGFDKIELSKIYRTDDEEFIKLLHQVRFGDVDEEVHNALNAFIKPIPNDLREFTFLFGKNASVAFHNRVQLDFIDEELIVKEAEIVIQDKKSKSSEIERFFEDARIDKALHLKVGAPVLFTRNSWNYYNGERGIVVKIEEEAVYVKKSGGTVVKLEKQKQSKTRWIQKEIDGKLEVVEEEIFSIYQYPIKLAFAITIHKSQGMSLDDLIIESNEIFAPSQFYVALSRAKNPSRLTLIAPKRQWSSIIYAHKKAKEFYMRKVFSNNSYKLVR
ncbi:Putative helicase [hydrothermal vent metagenome]|uniref:Putative helicase n=1 Tax=hydrothermal vent metagenome TaxID=652676 RepID=A0A1W1BYN7_9ZZZZ